MEKRISTSQIKPNPYQPQSRTDVPDEVAERFGKSILEHGLIQTPIVRIKADEYEMGDGWLRLSGFRWLAAHGHPDFEAIPVEVRVLTNRQMADLVLEANTVRKDLNPIEEAQFYQHYIEEFGVTETELAQQHNLTQGAVANTIRLLQLPQDIQEKVRTAELPATHARQLLRMNNAPEMQQSMVKNCIERNFTVNQLSDSIERDLWQNSESLNLKGDSWKAPKFDISDCKGCEFRTSASEPWVTKKKEDRCLNRDCWQKKNEAAIQTATKAALKQLKKETKGQKILTSKDISYNDYHSLKPYDLERFDNPQECETCPKTALYKSDLTRPGEPERICLSPSCARKKQTQKTKDENKLKKELDKELTLKLGETFKHVQENPLNCMVVLARHTLPRLSAQGKVDLSSMFDLPKLSNGRLDLDKLVASLNEKKLDELLQLTVAATITGSRRASTYEQFNIELKDDLKRDMAFLTGTLDKYIAEVIKWQERNCRSCRYCNEALLGTDNEVCINNAWAKRVNAEGICTGHTAPEQKKEVVVNVPEEGEVKIAD